MLIPTERENVPAGRLYDPLDSELIAAWIGGGVVVTRDVPAGVYAAGNPCRVIRPLEDEA